MVVVVAPGEAAKAKVEDDGDRSIGGYLSPPHDFGGDTSIFVLFFIFYFFCLVEMTGSCLGV